MKKPIDIIVPIYNAYEEVVRCYESVMLHTDMKNVNLIMINDCSTDSRIKEFLEIVKEQEGVVVLENQENLGFVKTTNLGMKYSGNDVILLNSDTIVTKGWIAKIQKCAYSEEEIGTVTPLSNNGAICSVPKFNVDNQIPQGYTIESFAELIEKISLKRYTEIPTGVGFCMYVKRELIDQIGYLDEELFGKGYGEENDFCMRAKEIGYINVICDDTFIYHSGSMSFENTEKLLSKNLSTLIKKYPLYQNVIDKFITSLPIRDIIDNVNLHLSIKNGKKNVLYFIHVGVFFDENITNYSLGGTELHLVDLLNNVDGYNKFVLGVNEREVLLSAKIEDKYYNFKFKMGRELNGITFSSQEYKEIVENIVKAFDIDLIHIHHLIKHPFSIFEIAKEQNIPLILSLHDFYCICPTINLLDADNKYCVESRCDEMCNKCISTRLNIRNPFMSTWSTKMGDFLQQSDLLITPSESAKEIIGDYYKNVNLNIRSIYHGVNIAYENAIAMDKREDETFNIAFIGGLTHHKGSGLIHDMIIQNKNKNIKWFLLGNIGDKKLELLNRPDVIKYGRYDRKDLNKIVSDLKINLIGILSIWPETYAYTLTEAWLTQTPTIVTNLGALEERTNLENTGWVIDHKSDAKAILNKINQIIDDKEEYNKKVEALRSMKFKTVEEMATEYSDIYKEYIKNKKKVFIGSNANMNMIWEAYNYANLEKEFRADQAEEIYHLYKLAQDELELIRNSIGWKALNKVRFKYPRLLRIGKKVLYKIVKIVKY